MIKVRNSVLSESSSLPQDLLNYARQFQILVDYCASQCECYTRLISVVCAGRIDKLVDLRFPSLLIDLEIERMQRQKTSRQGFPDYNP